MVFHCYEINTVTVNMQSFHNVFVLQIPLTFFVDFIFLFSATFLHLDVTAFCKSYSCSSFLGQHKLAVFSANVTVLCELRSDVITLLIFVWTELLVFRNLIFFTKVLRSFLKANKSGTCFGNTKSLIHTFLCSLLYYVFHC